MFLPLRSLPVAWSLLFFFFLSFFFFDKRRKERRLSVVPVQWADTPGKNVCGSRHAKRVFASFGVSMWLHLMRLLGHVPRGETQGCKDSVGALCCAVDIGKVRLALYFRYAPLNVTRWFVTVLLWRISFGGSVKCLVGFDRAEVSLIVRHYLRKLTVSAFEKLVFSLVRTLTRIGSSGRNKIYRYMIRLS